MELFVRIAFRSILFWFGLIWFVVGCGLILGGVVSYRTERTFRRESAAAQGTVRSKSIQKAVRGGNSRTVYEILYSFPLEGQTYEKRAEVSVERWEALTEGGPITVKYLPDDVLGNRIDDQTVESAMVAAVLGLIFGGIGGGLFLYSVRRTLREFRLRQGGISAEATVLKTRASNVTVNDVPQWEIHYSYRDAAGHEHQAKSDPLPPGQVRGRREGSRGYVRYDPRRPEESIWIGGSPADEP
ncbi:MAG TPA: DUF3592 domain-containing protein [Bryobacteraceae bacterium]|nr:DUF3592 domain-containing protein [Bryobacteraceae bacterium]